MRRTRRGIVMVCAALVIASAVASASARATRVPTAGTWVRLGAMNANRDFASAVRLERGRVLLAGGYYEDSADLYHPGTRKFIPTGTMFADQSFYTLAD